MSTSIASPANRPAELRDQTVLVMGGSAGIGLATAIRARHEGADVILTARNAERLEAAGRQLDARATAAFDANDTTALGSFFDGLDAPLDQVLVTAGEPHYGTLMELDTDQLQSARSVSAWPEWCRSPAWQPAGCDLAAPSCSWAAPAAAAPRSELEPRRRSSWRYPR
jgi:NAD(P)-dependent dehydrogenase (short-subunit alcohol dehydrogenase family)